MRGIGKGMSAAFWTTVLFKAGALVGFLLLVPMLWFGLPTTIRGTGVTDHDGNRRGLDFLTHYTAGRMVLAGDARHLYDLPVQAAAQEAALGAPLDRTSPFLLPPVAALLFAPLALLPYSVAATLWAVVAVALIVISLRLIWPLSPLRGQVPSGLVTLALVGTYPVGMNLVGGNNAALWLTIYALGARYLLTGRAIAAGLVLGFGALKPQLYLAVPVLLLVQRRWRALGAFAGVAGLLAAVSLALIGPTGAREYIEVLTSDTYRSEVAIPEAWRMLSLPALVRGVVPGVNDLVTVVIVIGGLVLLGWAVHRAPLPVAYAATVLVSVAIDPHCFLYDGMVLAVPILLRAGGTGWGAPSWALAALWLLTWAVPFRTPPEPGSVAAVPWTVLPLLALTAAALRDAKTQGDCPPPALPRGAGGGPRDRSAVIDWAGPAVALLHCGIGIAAALRDTANPSHISTPQSERAIATRRHGPIREAVAFLLHEALPGSGNATPTLVLWRQPRYGPVPLGTRRSRDGGPTQR